MCLSGERGNTQERRGGTGRQAEEVTSWHRALLREESREVCRGGSEAAVGQCVRGCSREKTWAQLILLHSPLDFYLLPIR